MKLFQIEEPDGTPLDAEGPGVAVGIEISPSQGAAVAVAVGGNAEILPGADGAPRLPAAAVRSGDGQWDEAALAALLLALRERAEKVLARPVTHAVIVADGLDEASRRALTVAAERAALTALAMLDAKTAAASAPGARASDAPVLGAAIKAEDGVA